MPGGGLTALTSALHPEKSVTGHPKPHFASPKNGLVAFHSLATVHCLPVRAAQSRAAQKVWQADRGKP